MGKPLIDPEVLKRAFMPPYPPEAYETRFYCPQCGSLPPNFGTPQWPTHWVCKVCGWRGNCPGEMSLLKPGWRATSADLMARKIEESMANLRGVGQGAPIQENEHGGKQSRSPYRFDLLQPLALAAVAEIHKLGCERYEEWNWLKIPSHEHLNHGLQHIFAFIAGDITECGDPIEHAKHAAWRILSWLEMLERERQQDSSPSTQESGPASPK